MDRYFVSKQCKEKLNKIKNYLNVGDSEILNKIDETFNYKINKRDKFKLNFERGERDCRKQNKKPLYEFFDEELAELEVSNELKNMNEDELLLSNDFNSLYPNAQIDTNSTWPKKETAYLVKKETSDAVCKLFNSGRWNELNRCAFLSVIYHNPKNLVF